MSSEYENPEMMEEYKRGYLEALNNYAWWKDGVLHVGCGFYTLKEAKRQLKDRCDGINKSLEALDPFRPRPESKFKIPEGDMPQPCDPGRIG
jgi:hypothetical protein